MSKIAPSGTQVPPDRIAKHANKKLGRFDADGNGKVDFKEFSDKRLQQFTKTYGETGLSLTTLKETLQKQVQAGKLTQERADARLANRTKQDTNGDGVVSLKEFEAVLKAKFDRKDKNGDGVWDAADFEKRHRGKKAPKAVPVEATSVQSSSFSVEG